ncbi:CubicO group peptidase, beta-lactamase class C family [Marivirga sericea]|uniref:CubicO group peptidase, beta-lactamase class C family n=1 Tax=Marivirga sericea TaxID=1028 RepID=A0A1X7L5X6_9BACT|nr:serine hydrolase [Marivirga sericea]SMG49160.1 CubicO group peptidase, beta-lactamase class C family [Marivirga sericea]
MRTHINKVIQLFPFLLLIFFSACKNQTSENGNQSFEWAIESPENSGIDEKILNSLVGKIKDSTLYGVDAIILVKNKKIVFEKYFNGFEADSLHNVTSVGKSITSALVGISIEKGYIKNKNEQIIQHFREDYKIENLSLEKENIQIHHLLTMSAGWDCDDWDENSVGNTMHFPNVPDDFAFTLNLPMIKPNGEDFSYCSGGANLLGEIIRRKSQLGLKDFANKYLFNKIGVTENEWFIAPKTTPYEFAGGGNLLKPRDLARFGLLYLNDGIWEGEQIIPKDWISESTSRQIETSEDGDYGYFWWVKEYNYNNKILKGFEASGNGGNKLVVIPEHNIVIILTGSAYGSEYVEGEQAKKIIEDFLLPSLIE